MMKPGNNLPPEVERFIGQVLQERASLELDKLLEGYRLTAKSEGRSQKTIDIVVTSIHHLERFCATKGLSIDVADIGGGALDVGTEWWQSAIGGLGGDLFGDIVGDYLDLGQF